MHTAVLTCAWMAFCFILQISKLIEYYQHLAHREKQERDRKKMARRRQCMPLAFSVQQFHQPFRKCHTFLLTFLNVNNLLNL